VFVSFCVVSTNSSTMAAAGAMWHGQTPDGGIVALHEATNAFYRAAPYCPGGMAIEIVIDWPAFLSRQFHCWPHHKLKTMLQS
jgi:hypothetical protein